MIYNVHSNMTQLGLFCVCYQKSANLKLDNQIINTSLHPFMRLVVQVFKLLESSRTAWFPLGSAAPHLPCQELRFGNEQPLVQRSKLDEGDGIQLVDLSQAETAP